MKKYIDLARQNPALAAGVGMPVILMVVFWLASVIPNMLTPPPQYDLLYSGSRYNQDRDADVRFTVVNGALKAEYRAKEKQRGGNGAVLYRFNVKDLTTQEIAFELPATLQKDEQWHVFDVAKAGGLKLDKTPEAPDGYKMLGEEDYKSRGLFHSYNRSRGIVLHKDGRNVKSAAASSGSTYDYSHKKAFLGWIIPEGSKP